MCRPGLAPSTHYRMPSGLFLHQLLIDSCLIAGMGVRAVWAVGGCDLRVAFVFQSILFEIYRSASDLVGTMLAQPRFQTAVTRRQLLHRLPPTPLTPALSSYPRHRSALHPDLCIPCQSFMRAIGVRVTPPSDGGPHPAYHHRVPRWPGVEPLTLAAVPQLHQAVSVP